MRRERPCEHEADPKGEERIKLENLFGYMKIIIFDPFLGYVVDIYFLTFLDARAEHQKHA